MRHFISVANEANTAATSDTLHISRAALGVSSDATRQIHAYQADLLKQQHKQLQSLEPHLCCLLLLNSGVTVLLASMLVAIPLLQKLQQLD